MRRGARTRWPFPPDPNPHKPHLVAPPGSWDCHFHLYGPPHKFPYAETRGFSAGRTDRALAAHCRGDRHRTRRGGEPRGPRSRSGLHSRRDRTRQRAASAASCEAHADTHRKRDRAAASRRRARRALSVCQRTRSRIRRAGLVRALVPRMERFGWIAQFHIDDDALDDADTIAGVHVPVVIDGFAGVVPSAGLDQPRARALLDLLRRPNVHLKIMCADREMHGGQRYEDIVALWRGIIPAAPGPGDLGHGLAALVSLRCQRRPQRRRPHRHAVGLRP